MTPTEALKAARENYDALERQHLAAEKAAKKLREQWVTAADGPRSDSGAEAHAVLMAEREFLKAAGAAERLKRQLKEADKARLEARRAVDRAQREAQPFVVREDMPPLMFMEHGRAATFEAALELATSKANKRNPVQIIKETPDGKQRLEHTIKPINK